MLSYVKIQKYIGFTPEKNQNLLLIFTLSTPAVPIWYSLSTLITFLDLDDTFLGYFYSNLLYLPMTSHSTRSPSLNIFYSSTLYPSNMSHRYQLDQNSLGRSISISIISGVGNLWNARTHKEDSFGMLWSERELGNNLKIQSST